MFKKYLLFLVFMCVAFSLSASHIPGGEITYRYVGANSYTFKFVYYVQCSFLTPPDSLYLGIKDSCGDPESLFPVYLSTVEDISGTCPGVQNSCDGGPYVGYKRTTYFGNYSINTICNYIKITFSDASRTGVNTLSNSTFNDFFIQAVLNNVNGQHSSPQFNPIEIPHCCLNVPNYISNTAFAIDSSSLTFELVAPLVNDTDTVRYEAGYSSIQPVSGNVNLSSLNGLLTVIPTNVELGVYAVKVKQFENGVLIGEVTRDILIFVDNCSNNQPAVSGFNNSLSYSLDVCALQNNCFQISTSDIEGSLVSIGFTTPLPFALIPSAQPGIYSTCWYPDLADTLLSPIHSQLRATDGHCPFMGVRTVDYTFNILSPQSAYCTLLNSSITEKNKNFSIYPNPAHHSIQLDLINSDGWIKITSVDGKMIKLISITSPKMDVSLDLESGVYLISMLDKNQSTISIKRLVVEN